MQVPPPKDRTMVVLGFLIALLMGMAATLGVLVGLGVLK